MRRWMILMGVLGLASSARAGAAELTVEQLVQLHIEAIGGSQNLAHIKSLKKAGTYAYNGLEHPMISYHQPGGRCREEIEGLQLYGTSVLEGQRVVRGADGERIWIQDESRTPEDRPISIPRAALMLEEADLFGALVDHEGKGHRVELIGRGEVEGSPTHHLRVVLASGIVVNWHLDTQSHLALRKEVELSPEMESEYELPRAWQYDDYRSVDGVLLPFWVYVEERVFAREYLFDTIQAGVEMDDSIFEPPPGATVQSPR